MCKMISQKLRYYFFFFLQMSTHLYLKGTNLILQRGNLIITIFTTLIKNSNTYLLYRTHVRNQFFMTRTELFMGHYCTCFDPWEVDIFFIIMMFMYTFVEVINIPLGEKSNSPCRLV